MQKILVVQTAFIGDVVLATGLLEKLHAAWPDAAIDILVRKGNESLFTGHPFLREVLVWDKKSSKYKQLFGLIRDVRRKKYDLLVNVQRFAATGLLTIFSGAKRKVGFDKNPFSFLFSDIVRHAINDEDASMHEVERNHQLVSAVTDEQFAKPKLYPTAQDYAFVQQWKTKPYVCIAPASVWFTKQYPAAKWIDLIRALPQSMNVFLLGGPGDQALCEEIKNAITGIEVANLAGKLNYLQSAALQQDAQMNYVNDSAPMHFASAVNAPVTAVYCSTVPLFGFGPLSSNSHIVQIETPLACRPCGLHGRKACPLGHFNCAIQIHTEQLLATLPR